MAYIEIVTDTAIPPTPGMSRPAPARDPHDSPAIGRWIDRSRRRHFTTLGIAVVLLGAAHLFGAIIDWRAYAVFGAWLLANAVVSPWAVRPVDHDVRLRRYALTLAMDVLFLGAAYLFLDGAEIIGAVFFAHQTLVGSATLPRQWSIGIAALIVAVFASLLVSSALGLVTVPSPIGADRLIGNWPFVVASVTAAVAMVVLVMHLQVQLVRSIRDVEERYVTLVQSAADMVMTFDASGHFLEVNPATLEQTGYTWDEIKKLPNTTFFPPADWTAVLNAFGRALAGESLRNDARIVRKDGTERWIQATTSPVTLDGQAAVLVIARDMTESRRQTDELREKDAQLKVVLGALNIGFLTFDRDRRVTSAFGSWARNEETRGATLVGGRLHDLLSAGTIVEQHQRADDRVLAGEEVSVRWTHQTPEGERWYRSHVVPIRAHDATITGGAAIWVDETAMVLADREREELRKRVTDTERVESLGKLVSGVAHELNNPLAAILNFTEDLLSDDRSPEERMALEVIQSQALRSRTIVRDLLTYARQGSARPLGAAESGPMLESIARAMRPGLASQGVAFVVELDGSGTELLLDRAGFEQVVTNLITNAAHSAGAGGTVRLSSRRRRDWFEVVVEDNGAGIGADVFPRIFEPFFTTKPTGQGVGLGLSVSLGIVTAHRGTLTAENRPAEVGGGARFVMRIPLMAASVTTGAESSVPERRLSPAKGRVPILEPASGPRAMPQRRPTILIIDDEPAIRQGLKRFLTRRGWAVEESADGADALSKLMRPEALRIYDVILCDLKMAGVSGMDVFDRVRATVPSIAKRFILSTGDTTAPDVAGFLSQVDVPILEKPFELTTLETLAEQIRSGGAFDMATAGPGPA